MWMICFLLSVAFLALSPTVSLAIKNNDLMKKSRLNILSLSIGVFLASLALYLPINIASQKMNFWGVLCAVLLTLFDSIQIFGGGGDFGAIQLALQGLNPDWLRTAYSVWSVILIVLAPVLTLSFIVTLVKNLWSYIRYFFFFKKDIYVFSELNQKSLSLASDIKANHEKSVIIFADVSENDDEGAYELKDSAKALHALCFKTDMPVINFRMHSDKRHIYFFAISDNEAKNLNQTLKLIELYKDRANTDIYLFSTKKASEILLSSIDKGEIKVRRINEARSLINRIFYEDGKIIYDTAREAGNGKREISAVIVGMGRHSEEMVKALSWFGQMDGYSLEINAFDLDKLAEDKFIASAPELMSDKFNGVIADGEAQYKISVHSGLDVNSVSFVREIQKIKNATYVLVALGNDDLNINTAVQLRTYFERMGIKPYIQAIVYNTQQKNALACIKNHKGQLYDIDFIGDIESSYNERTVMASELENEALERHLKWAKTENDRVQKEKEFWDYEYNYRSSFASAVHMKARVYCKIHGADKKTEELTEAERDTIERLEHRRWNAYMRSEGYIFSGSTEEKSRNDLAKIHNNLTDYASLDEAVKRKDSDVGTR